MTRNQRFRALFRLGQPFVCMGAFDAITAKLAEASGAQAIFVSGFVACGVEARARHGRAVAARHV